MSASDDIRVLAEDYALRLRRRIAERVDEMETDDSSHMLLYRVLGVADEEGRLIDTYQNSGRFLYRYVGSFLEDAVKYCFTRRFPDAGSIRIPNTQSEQPQYFEIDCLVGSDAIEIKWRDATTDGDHIAKENSRLKAVSEAGYNPVRVMFYYLNRTQAVRIQERLESLYDEIGGQYHHGDAAWTYVQDRTGVDLKTILEELGGSSDSQ